MASPRQLTCYFDFLSPYAYLAWEKLPEVAQRHGLTVVPRPVLLAGVLGAIGTKGPAESPGRRLWTFKHVMRRAHDWGVALRMPPAHPFNPLLALRVAGLYQGAEQLKVVDALFEATWKTGAGVDGPEAVGQVLAGLGYDAAAVIARAGEAAAKERIRANTEELIRIGGFGVPTFVIDGELFFGGDDLPALERFVRGEDVVTKTMVETILATPATATRKV